MEHFPTQLGLFYLSIWDGANRKCLGGSIGQTFRASLSKRTNQMLPLPVKRVGNEEMRCTAVNQTLAEAGRKQSKAFSAALCLMSTNWPHCSANAANIYKLWSSFLFESQLNPGFGDRLFCQTDADRLENSSDWSFSRWTEDLQNLQS